MRNQEGVLMWNEIRDENTLQEFMETIGYFHDSCIKEMKYVSGAYVNDDLSMHPVNDRRILHMLIQRQYEENSMIEIEFEGVKWLKLVPADEQYSCEILDATMIIKEDCIYWCDCGGLAEDELKDYDGTLICASKVRWRSVSGSMGKQEFYRQESIGSVESSAEIR